MAVRLARDRFGWVGPVLSAAALATLGIGVAAAEQDRSSQLRALDVVGIALLLGGSLPVAFARRWAVVAYLVALTSIAVYQALGYTIQSPYFLGVLLTGYQAAAPRHRLRTAALALLAFPLYAVGAVVTGRPELSYGVPTLAVAAFLAGQVASELRAASERREAQARAEAELRLLTEERLRIARELHDVISHGIATIGVQAGVAAHVIDEHPEQAREALRAIKAVSRDAMRDLRGMLGVLREADDTDVREPAPGLARLPELVKRVRAGGVQVELDVEGAACALTPATDLAAYRVVQEALTNVIRYAPGASAQVHVRYAPHELQIEVVDDGRTDCHSETSGPAHGTGHGLVGLRERAATLGGILEAGPVDGGGFRVTTRLPIGSNA